LQILLVEEAEAVLKYIHCGVQAGVPLHSDLDVLT
jgi:hypothetical protein